MKAEIQDGKLIINNKEIYDLSGALNLYGCTGLTALPDGLGSRVKGEIYL